MANTRITFRLPLYVGGGFIAFAVALILVLLSIGRATLTTGEMKRLAAEAAMYRSAVQFYVSNAEGRLEVAAKLVAPVIDSNPAEARRILSVFLTYAGAFEYLQIVRPDGTVLAVEPSGFESGAMRNLAFRDWFQTALNSKAVTVSNLHISLVTNRPSVTIAVPFFGDNRGVDGILAGSLKLDELSKVGIGTERGGARDEYGYLADSRGLILAHQENSQYVIDQTDFSSEPTVQKALAGKEGTMSFFDPVERQWMLGAYLPVHLAGSAHLTTMAVGFVVPQEIAYRPIATFTRVTGGTALVFAFAIGFVAFILIRRFLGPVDQLITAVRQAGTGDFTFRIEHKRDDEFSVLTRAYNEMVAGLAEKDKKISEHEQSLRTMNRQLTETNRELEAFSYSVSHDLRAPLRSIDGFSHALLEDFGGELTDTALDYLGRIRRAVQTMGHLIEDMLKLSRVNRAEILREDADLSEIVRLQAKELMAREPERNAEFTIVPDASASADRRLLQILIANLLENAWKFTRTRPETRIEFGTVDRSGSPAFFIRDNGVGFDMKYAGKLFSAFQRLHSAGDYEGTGIGLAIVQRIVNLHHGRVWVEAAVDKGAAFYFSLSETEDP